jgi:cytochrome b subunit of formate dehydrogenase
MAHHQIFRLLGLCCLGLLFAAGRASGATETKIDCMPCHGDATISPSEHSKLDCTDCHEGITKMPEQGKPHPEPVLTDACEDCHSRVGRKVNKSVHAEDTQCQSCHGAAHKITDPTSLESPLAPTKQIRTCGECHEKERDGYLSGVHSKALLASGLVSAPSCTDCHGDHSIRPSSDKRSLTSHAQVPEVCGKCHAGILRTWKASSVHGKAWQENDSKGPICTTCHTAHSMGEPTRGGTRLGIPQECEQCHSERYTSYRGSFHGKATDLGFEPSAICSDCHTAHGELPASDPRSSIHPTNLGDTCGECHSATTAAFLTFQPHSDPTHRERTPALYYVWIFMTALLFGVFGFFGLHDALWLQRALVGWLRGEFGVWHASEGPHIRRFGRQHIWTHVVMVTTFLLLAATGLPLKFHDAVWAHTLVNVFGGVESTRIIHRVAAVATFGYGFYHLAWILVNAVRTRARGLFWGPDSLVPQPRDFVEAFRNLRYFFYLGPKPTADRWTYWEKFDYMAVFWGIPIIGISGLMVWFPEFFTRFAPGWILNAAYIVHSDEALLATGFIFVFHFFHTHLRPESFPLDPAIFTGRIPLERFKEERPIEYARLVAENELESRLVEAPTCDELTTARMFGFTALTLGVLLAIGIFWAMIGAMLP